MTDNSYSFLVLCLGLYRDSIKTRQGTSTERRWETFVRIVCRRPQGVTSLGRHIWIFSGRQIKTSSARWKGLSLDIMDLMETSSRRCVGTSSRRYT